LPQLKLSRKINDANMRFWGYLKVIKFTLKMPFHALIGSYDLVPSWNLPIPSPGMTAMR
jgi:hypothetical protein